MKIPKTRYFLNNGRNIFEYLHILLKSRNMQQYLQKFQKTFELRNTPTKFM